MIIKKVTYKVKPRELETVKKAVRVFVKAIHSSEPETIYEAYEHSGDETSFTHFMAFPNLKAEKKHQTAEYTLRFVKILYPNCSKKPVFTDLKKV
ncbi:hypothetical protein HUU53_01480 [Candidatus Micrarchaeota archaeon]|nr:hypothetical protein [Candidatus Micrarchaeota archaeon]